MAVPQGTVQDVLDWVGDDPGRAREALDAEQAGQQRTTLISKLEDIADQEDAVTDQTQDPPQTNPSTGSEGTVYTDPVDDPAAQGEPVNGEEAEELPAPEQPTEVALDPADTGTVVGPVHARDVDVEVPEETLEPVVEPEEVPEPELIEAEQVEFFQVAGGTNGVIVSINGTGFALLPQMAAALKTNLDKAVAGLAL